MENFCPSVIDNFTMLPTIQILNKLIKKKPESSEKIKF